MESIWCLGLAIFLIFGRYLTGNLQRCLDHTRQTLRQLAALLCTPRTLCHALNPIPGFVTMTGMLISSLNLILTRTNLTFSKFFQNASLFLFILVSLLLDIIFHLIVRASTPYSKYNIIHQSFNFHTFT